MERPRPPRPDTSWTPEAFIPLLAAIFIAGVVFVTAGVLFGPMIGNALDSAILGAADAFFG